jgi:ABC-2 type transport system ATP-binding protein
MIETVNLTREFGSTLAVDGLTLTIAAGEVFGFLGPNGAGKTTTVRMLTTLIGASAGTAKVAGYSIDGDEQQIRRHVGLLTETPGLYERLSAARNLEIFANLYEVEDVSGQVEKYLRMLGLWDRRNETTGSFSKGMKQKLAVARALLHEPQVLFLDEPTAGLDPEASRLVRDFVGELRAEGRTIFLTTHNLDEAERLCDRIAVFNQRLRVVDSPSGLRRLLYGRQVVFHLRETAEPFAELLRAFDTVQTVDALDNKLVASVAEPENANPELIRALVNAGADIQFVGELRHSLEDIYLQLVNA